MTKRALLLIVLLFLALLVLPLLLTQLLPRESRTLIGVELDDTDYQEVNFHNAEQDLDLAGMLFLPEGEGPFPAVVAIHGAGSSHRDNPWDLANASYLQENGIVVLLPDKRGSELSEGDWRTASFPDLATDTMAAISYLQDEHSDVISEIGVLGTSQGGQVAPIVAAQSSEVAFVINVVGSVVPFHDALVYEENHNLREFGMLPGFSNIVAPISSFYIRRVAQKGFWDAIGNYDPLPYWSEVDVPALVLYGAEDTNTPTYESARRLESLDKSNLRVVIFEGSGHPLEDPEGRGDSYFREDALALMHDFIFEAASKP
jgi:dipeptidyl aminopeptidase/acylaminoacyl peptidase